MNYSVFAPPLHFGLGFPTPLPEGWTLREAPEEWAIGIDPSGQEYYLSRAKAYPRRQANFVKNPYMIDTKNGVVSLIPSPTTDINQQPKQTK